MDMICLDNIVYNIDILSVAEQDVFVNLLFFAQSDVGVK